MKQIIIVRKDLNMSKGKMAAQVAHASMAFLTNAIKHHVCGTMTDLYVSPIKYYKCSLYIPEDIYKEWICGSFTKVILEAKNKYQLEKIYTIANELGLKENVDYFPIKDNCYTELEPEEVDENGIGRTLTCVGFIPLNDEIANKISKKYQLYKEWYMKEIVVKLQLDDSQNDKNLNLSDEEIKEDIELGEIGFIYYYSIKSIEVKDYE